MRSIIGSGEMHRRIIGLFATRGGIVGLNFASLLIVAALMEPAEFGAFVFLWSAAQLLSAFAGLGSVNYLMREGSARQGDPARGVSPHEALRIAFGFPALMLAGCATVFSALAFGFGDASAFANVGLADILCVCAAAGALIALSHSATPLRLNEWQTASMIVRDAGPQSIILLVVAVDYLFDALTPATVLFAFAIIGAVVAAVAIAVGLRGKTALWREADGASHGGQSGFWGSAIVGMGATQFDVFIGGFFLREEELGVYQIIKRLANLVGMPQTITNWAYIVRLGKHHANGQIAEIRQDCANAVVWGVLPGLVLLVALTVAMPFLFEFYEVADAGTAWIVFYLLAASNIVNLSFGLNVALAAQSNREHIAFAARAFALTIGIIALLILVEFFDQIALASAALIVSIIINVSVSFHLWRALEVDTTFLAVFKRRIEEK